MLNTKKQFRTLKNTIKLVRNHCRNDKNLLQVPGAVRSTQTHLQTCVKAEGVESFSEVLRDSVRFCEVLRGFQRFSEVLQDSQGFSELLRGSVRFSEVL